MLHLFKKIYVEVDYKISINQDRIVISDEHGNGMLDVLEKNSDGKLLDFSKKFDDIIVKYGSFVKFMQFVSKEQDKTNKPIIIFADKTAFVQIVSNWYKLIFKNPDAEKSYSLFKSYCFREKLFSSGRLSINKIKSNLDFDKIQFISEFNSAVISNSDKINFLKDNKSTLSIEYLLSSYLFDGSCKDELKNRVKILIRIDLEKYLFELKEIILVHLLRKKFQKLIGATTVYDFSNFYDMIDDESPLIRVFFKPELWSDQGLVRPSSSGTVNFQNMTQDDVDNIMKFTELAGQEWEEKNFYRFNKSDMGKMAFVKHLQTTNLSDEGLKEIIDFEIRGNHAAGSFYSIDLQTVNHYFIDFVLNSIRENKKENIRHYCV